MTKPRSTRCVRVLTGGPTAMRPGPNVAEMERQIAALFGKPLGVMCNSGSSALYLAVELLDLPVGSEVITSPLTFSTDIAPIVRAGCVPVFVDVEPDTFNVDVTQDRGDDHAFDEGDVVPQPDRQRARLGRHPRDRRRPRPEGDRGLLRWARCHSARHADRHPLRHLGDELRDGAHHHLRGQRWHGGARRRRAARPRR